MRFSNINANFLPWIWRCFIDFFYIRVHGLDRLKELLDCLNNFVSFLSLLIKCHMNVSTFLDASVGITDTIDHLTKYTECHQYQKIIQACQYEVHKYARTPLQAPQSLYEIVK